MLDGLQNGKAICLTKQAPLSPYPRTVMSVPHSGTRTLIDFLGIKAQDYGLPGGKWWHFGMHYERVLEYKEKSRLQLSIPIRNPYNVAMSWADRGKSLPGLVAAYGQMFEVIEMLEIKQWLAGTQKAPELKLVDGLGQVLLYKTEMLPTLVGHDDRKPGCRYAVLQEYVNTIDTLIVKPHRKFFEDFGYELR